MSTCITCFLYALVTDSRRHVRITIYIVNINSQSEDMNVKEHVAVS